MANLRILKIPFSAGTLGKNTGCSKAPEAVLKQLEQVSANENGVRPLYEVEDVLVKQDNIEETSRIIQERVKDISQHSSGRILLIGGDHSITGNAFKAFHAIEPNSCLIILDAHPDSDEQAGTATHDTFVRDLIESGIAPNKILQIGIRAGAPNEYSFLKDNNIRYYSAKQVFSQGIREIADLVMEQANRFKAVYLSIDIDVLDPGFAPATGYCEPAGLTPRELLFFIQKMRFLKNLKMIDLVEINPEKDINNMTLRMGAKIVAEFC